MVASGRKTAFVYLYFCAYTKCVCVCVYFVNTRNLKCCHWHSNNNKKITVRAAKAGRASNLYILASYLMLGSVKCAKMPAKIF